MADQQGLKQAMADRKLPGTAMVAWLVGLIALLGGAAPAAALSSDSAWTQHAELRLLAATDAIGEAGTATVGLEFALEPEWHIYWRAPGDAGLPPVVDWSQSQNVAGVEMLWPLPTRYELLGFTTLAYSDHVIFPLQVAAADPSLPVVLNTSVNFLICAEICIPDSAEITLTLPPGTAAGTPFAHQIDQFRASVPGAPQSVGLFLEDVTITGEGDAGQIVVAFRSDAPITAPDLFFEAPPEFVFAQPEAAVSADGMSAVMTAAISSWGAGIDALQDSEMTLTLVDDNRAMEQVLVPARYVPGEIADGGTAGAAVGNPGEAAPVAFDVLLTMMAVALLGGLILNLMPCVLPVLSLKVLSVIKYGGGARGHVRLGFSASAAGIVFSFLVLAAGAVALKSAGVAVGWGIQFQQPLFLVAMLLIVAVFAYNMLGLFEFSLPGRVANLAARAGDDGPPDPNKRPKLANHFLTGAFATLLATPCSAPFVGTALGFALARGAMEVFLIFAAMGVGLALPYILIALFPAMATKLPKPGRWMVWVRRVMGLALVATAVWLLTVLAGQVGWQITLGIAALVVLIGGVYLARRFVPAARLARNATAAALVLALAAMLVPVLAPQSSQADRPDANPAWAAFDQAQIAAMVAEGRTVFVDVTADWCLTCLYNKKAVMDRGPVAALIADREVVAMRADWTNPDPTIADYLASFGRYGIPFNAVYGPGAPEGIALPELLSDGDVLDAVALASEGEITGAAFAAQ